MFEELRPTAVKRMLTFRSLAYGQVRLLPKKSGFRPITNLKKRPEYIQNGRRLLGKSTNSLLTPVFKVLSHELSRRPRYLGSSLLSVSSIQAKLASFRAQLPLDLHQRPLYFVKVDVQSCFDTIPPHKVLPLLKALLKDNLYALSTSAQVRTPRILQRSKGPSYLKPCVKFSTLGHPAKRIIRVDEQAQEALAAAHGGTVYVAKTGVQTKTVTEMVKLLTEHLENNVVKLGRKFYRQKKGIPQGSVVSSLLCNVFYGRLESGELEFIKRSDTVLMRLVDDFLLISTERDVAVQFLDVMHAGIPDFGIKVKPEKTLTNFTVTIHNHPIASTSSIKFPYCGILIDTKSLNITKDADRTSTQGIIDSLTIETSSLPGKSFRQKALNALRIQLHPFLFDTSHNSRFTVCKNLYDTFHSAALRLFYYVKALRAKKRPGSSIVVQTISDLLGLAYRVLRRKTARMDQKFECAVSKDVMMLLGYGAFSAVLKGRQTGYVAVVKWIEKEHVKTAEKLKGAERKLVMKVMDEAAAQLV